MALIHLRSSFRRYISEIMTVSLKLTVLIALLNTAQDFSIDCRAARHLGDRKQPNQDVRTVLKSSRDDNSTKSYHRDSSKGYRKSLFYELVGKSEPGLGNARRRERRGRAVERPPRNVDYRSGNYNRRRRLIDAVEYNDSIHIFPKELQEKITQTDNMEEHLATELAANSTINDKTFASFVEQWGTAREAERKVFASLLRENKIKNLNYSVGVYRDIRSTVIIPDKRESISKLWAVIKAKDSVQRRNLMKQFEMALRDEKQTDDYEIRQAIMAR